MDGSAKHFSSARATPIFPRKTTGAAATPVVSIGLPVFNGERFLAGALESLLNQSYGDMEIILSDNASTDGTRGICAHYARLDERVRYFRQKENIGAPANWNYVVEEARGRYFKWASANDICDSRLVEECVNALEGDPGAVLCYGHTRLIDDGGSLQKIYEGDVPVVDARPSERLRTVCTSFGLNNAQSGLIRLDALRRTRLDRPYPGGDMVLMAELALMGRFLLLPGVLLERRMGPSTFSSLLSEKEMQQFFDPRRKSSIGFLELRLHMDYFRTILGARLPSGEKLRSLSFAARNAYWQWAAGGRARTT